jgi:uncharacterized protein YlbG (UPF0298 family)
MSKSYEKVNYLLRPKKQIERKLIIETLQQLDSIIEIQKYHYFGFGSIYFADFILFHKYLNINKMTSIDDKAEDEKRFLFNKPFEFIDFEISKSNIFLEKKLNWRDRLLIWLDYDADIDLSMVNEVHYIASKAKLYDILFVTIEAEAPENPESLKSFQNEYGLYIPPEYKVKDVKQRFPETLNCIMNGAVKNGLKNQAKYMSFLQLFNIVYHDSKTMYTFGGIFCEKEKMEELKKKLNRLRYIKHDNTVETINCPLLTHREKLHIDKYIRQGRIGRGARETGVEVNQLEDYRRYYKYYPLFFESIY